MPAGRPPGSGSKKTPENMQAVLEGLSKGIVLEAVLKDLNIGRTTVYDWIAADKEFAERYARAREVGYDAIAESCFTIADDSSDDVKLDKDGNPRTDSEVVQRSKLRVWTRLELLKRWDPKRYGDRQAVEHTGKDGGPMEFTGLSDDQLKSKIAALLAANPALKEVVK